MISHADPAIEHYLRTGEAVDLLDGPSGDFLAVAIETRARLLAALVAEVRQRTASRPLPPLAFEGEVGALVRRRLAPMVRGLFPGSERATVLGVIEQSVTFLTPDSIEQILTKASWASTAWNLANLYLDSIGADRLSEDAPRIVGFSEGTTCYVSTDYFRETGRFEDFVVHEAAHVFHNCKRVTMGLPASRAREWLLDIGYGKRELFAYACEAYSRIVGMEDDRAARQRLMDELEGQPMPADERVNAGEYVAVLRCAVESRNGWKAILKACAPARTRRIG